jgi:hypothetical protein
VENKVFGILDTKPRHVGFTLNSDTPYGPIQLDLRAGPMVLNPRADWTEPKWVDPRSVSFNLRGIELYFLQDFARCCDPTCDPIIIELKGRT